VVEQTDLWVVAGQAPDKDLPGLVRDTVHALRGQLKAHLALDPHFGASLEPVAVPDHAPPMIREMAAAAKACDVGPMAAVAGTIAEHVARALAQCTPQALVENGGDCFLFSQRPRTVALLPDPSAEASIGLALEAGDFPLSLCASSATIGHSLSLGRGDLVVVRSRSGSLADAAATALGNALKRRQDLGRVVDRARAMEEHGLDGVFAQCGGQLAVWGKMELAAL
jgi:hypothetical protein